MYPSRGWLRPLERFIIAILLSHLCIALKAITSRALLLIAFLVFATFSGLAQMQFASAQQYNLKLGLAVAPAVVPADGGTYMIYVYVTDLAGKPAAAPSSLSIALFSSDQRIGSVQAGTNIALLRLLLLLAFEP